MSSNYPLQRRRNLYFPDDANQAPDDGLYSPGPELGGGGQPQQIAPNLYAPASKSISDVESRAPQSDTAGLYMPSLKGISDVEASLPATGGVQASDLSAPAPPAPPVQEKPKGDIYSQLGVRPPKIYSTKDPEVQNQLSWWESNTPGVAQRLASRMTEADQRRAQAEMTAAGNLQYHQEQMGFYRNMPHMSQPYSVVGPNGENRWQAHNLVTGQVVDLGLAPASSKNVSPLDVANARGSATEEAARIRAAAIEEAARTRAGAQRPFAPQLLFSPDQTPIVWDPNRSRASVLPGYQGAPPQPAPSPNPQMAPPPTALPGRSAAQPPGQAPSATASPSALPPGPWTKGGTTGMTAQQFEETAQSLAKMDEDSLNRASDVASWRGGERGRLFARAKEINPQFSWAEIQRKQKMMENVTVGKDSQNLRSFGIFLQHAAELENVAQQFNQTTPQLLNRSINWFKQNVTADPLYQRIVAAIEPVNYEYQTFINSGRALYQAERDMMGQMLSGNMTLGQTVAAINQMGRTSLVRYNEIDNSFRRVMGKSMSESRGAASALSPQAIQGARAIGLDLSGTSVGKGGGNTPGAARSAPQQQFSHISSSGKYGWDGTKWVPINQ